MVEIKHIKNRQDGQPDFPQEIWDKKRAVALLDFEQFSAQKNIQLFRETQWRGAYTCAYNKSYQHFLDTLDNKALEKNRWEKEVGTLHILEDLKQQEDASIEPTM